ncbi:hypothetical protein FB451DRAFT_1561164, partial [Mycena latifolia]
MAMATTPQIKMPPQSTVPQIRLSNIVTCLGAALTTLGLISTSLDTPFLRSISNTTVNRNKDHCIQMLEQIHELLYGIIHFHITSDTGCELPPNMLYELGKLTETLHKIHTFFEAQQEKSRLKQFFRQGEMRTLLQGCHLGLQQALAVFRLQGLHISSVVAEMQEYAQKTQEDVLNLISAFSDKES